VLSQQKTLLQQPGTLTPDSMWFDVPGMHLNCIPTATDPFCFLALSLMYL